MSDDRKIDHRREALLAPQIAYVKALQEAVHKSKTEARIDEGRIVSIPTDQFKKSIAAANERLREALEEMGQPKVGFRVGTKETTSEGESKVRVTHPTQTVLSAEVSPSKITGRVEFYQTRQSGDGVPETKLLGVEKYPDRSGNRHLTFTTDRFARRPDEALVIHAELLDGNGFLLAAHAVGLVE